jgi:hypothetical protein
MQVLNNGRLQKRVTILPSGSIGTQKTVSDLKIKIRGQVELARI